MLGGLLARREGTTFVSGREAPPCTAVMTVHLPHLPRQRSALALTALTCVLCAAPTTAALAQQPDATPLWKAYPLTHAKGRAEARTSARPGSAHALGSDRALGGQLACADAPRSHGASPLGCHRVLRRRWRCVAVVASGAARSRGAPTSQDRRVRDQLVARATRATPSSPPRDWTASSNGLSRGRGASSAARRSVPAYDAASREAYEQLLRDLYADGLAALRARPPLVGDAAAPRVDLRDVDAGATWLIAVSRAASLVRGGAALAAGGAALAVWPRTTVSAPSAKQDAEILRFALTVEDLQAAFYVDAVKRGALRAARCSSSRGPSAATSAPTRRTSASSWAPARRSPDLRLRRHQHHAARLRPHRDRARGARARRLQRSGHESDPRRAGRRLADRVGRGAPRVAGSATSIGETPAPRAVDSRSRPPRPRPPSPARGS